MLVYNRYQSNKMKQQIKQEVSQSQQNKNRYTPNHTSKLGNRQYVLYLKSMPRLSTLIFNIQKYLSTYDNFYYNAFISSIKGKDLDTLEKQLKEEYDKLLSGKSFLQKINKANMARQKCLQKIKYGLAKTQQILPMFKKQYIDHKKEQDKIFAYYTKQQHYSAVTIDATVQSAIKVISNLFVQMTRLRDMTIYIIETVHCWRVEIQQWMDICKNHSRVDFYIQTNNDQNKQSIKLYDKIKTDTDFLWNSKIAQYIYIQYKNDPLLTRNAVNVSQREEKQILQKYFVQILSPSTNQLIDKTIKAIQMLSHVYKPKLINLYEEQEKLIENYLGLEKRKMEQIGLQDQELDIPIEGGNFKEFLPNQKKNYRSHSLKKLKQVKIIDQQIEGQPKNLLEFKNPYTSRVNSSNNVGNYAKNNDRGWVFGKVLSRNATEKIRQIVKRHQQQINYIKGHKNIIRTDQFENIKIKKKQQVALAYLSENNLLSPSEKSWMNQQNNKTPKKAHKKQIKIEIESEKQYENKNRQKIEKSKQSKSDSETVTSLQKSRRRMYQSLVRVNNSIIQEDPKQHEVETPKIKNNKHIIQMKLKLSMPYEKDKHCINKMNKLKTQQNSSRQQLSKTINKNQTKKTEAKYGHQNIKNGAKFNSKPQLLGSQNEFQQKQVIQVQQDQTPINFKEFLQTFRADTNASKKQKINIGFQQNVKLQQNKKSQQDVSPFRKIIKRSRIKSMKNIQINSIYNTNKGNKQKSKPKQMKEKSIKIQQNSFEQYKKVNLNKSNNEQLQKNNKKLSIQNVDLYQKKFINLQTKQIPRDMVFRYVHHVCKQVPLICQSFTNYHTSAYKQKLVQMLQDCSKNSLIFDLEVQKEGKIGQAIVVQSLSSHLKMRYTIEFISSQKFQLMARCVSRISEQLLSTTPCQETIFKLVQDKADPVSSHFIAILDAAFKKLTDKICFLHVLQKQIMGLSNQKLFQRVYIFQSKSLSIIKQNINNKYKSDWRKRVAGSNYRSLIVQTKCLVLTNNFKLRSQSLNKPIIENYRQQSLGMLYVMLFEKILTKFHLKQLKIASLSLNDADQTSQIVKKSPYFRSLFNRLLQIIRNTTQRGKQYQLSTWYTNSITKFASMTDLLNYLAYKQYDKLFKFEFLVESRFVMNHQLNLCEVNLSFSLDFLIQNAVGLILLNNHHNFIIQQIVKKQSNRQQQSASLNKNSSNGYLIPTTELNLKLFIMSARQYLNCSSNLDLFTYLQLMFDQSLIKQNHGIEQIAIPDLTKHKSKVCDVRMFDGFMRLFPERQFYSSSMINISNLWENYYPNAVISQPISSAVIIEYPLIIGFYDSVLQHMVVSFILKQQREKQK